MIRTAHDVISLDDNDGLDPDAYDIDAIGGDTVGRQASHTVGLTGNVFVDGLLSGNAWTGSKITYAFPNSKNDYNYTRPSNEKNNGFHAVNGNIEAAARFILDQSTGGKANDGFSVEGFTKLKVSEGGDASSTIRYAESSVPATAWGYFPSSAPIGGDVWFGKAGGYETAKTGNYAWDTVMHETGHALGLKHGHEVYNGFPTLPFNYDSLETSIMTYRSFVGDKASYYKNEYWGGPQTFMMADIAALQSMYGADFTTNQGSTIYKWTPGTGNTYVNGNVALSPGGNRIFATIWDGGGAHDTYNLSAYHNNVSIDLRPGGHSTFKNSQLADLGANSNDGPGVHIASGNIYNALQFKGDKRSLIEDAVGGSGNDAIWGNQGKNHLEGGGGNDRFYGDAGNDIYAGNGGDDIFFFRKGWDEDTIDDFHGKDTINLKNLHFADFDAVVATGQDDGENVTLVFGNGDNLTIENMHKADLHANDFIL